MRPDFTTYEIRHVARIEALEGMPFVEAVQRRYFDERTPGHILYKRWGLQYRSFRALLEKHGIELKSRRIAVAEQWVDAPERRQQVSDRLKATRKRYPLRGDDNPSRRPEVRAKISAVRKVDNPAQRPEVRAKMSASRRALYEAHPEKHPNRFMGRHRRSKIERMMDAALHAVGIHALHGQRIGRRWPDLMIPSARLVVECDGQYWHTPEADAIRDAELQAAGWSVLHFTDTEIVNNADGCARTVLAWLDAHADHAP